MHVQNNYFVALSTLSYTRSSIKFYCVHNNGCFFLFGVEESIVNAPPDYNFDQLFKSNLTFCVVCVFNLQFVKSVF
jgi:hypothetical protein